MAAWLHGSWVDCSLSWNSLKQTAQHNLRAVGNLTRKYQWKHQIKTSFYNLTFKVRKFTIKRHRKRLRVSLTVRSDHKNIVDANTQINQGGSDNYLIHKMTALYPQLLNFGANYQLKEVKREREEMLHHLSTQSQDSPTFSGVILTVSRDAITSGRAGGEPSLVSWGWAVKNLKYKYISTKISLWDGPCLVASPSAKPIELIVIGVAQEFSC